MTKSLRIFTAACIGALALTAVYALFLNAPSIAESFPKWDRSFDRAAWVRTPAESRYVFTDDLIERKVLIGKSRSEVIALLGPPERSDPLEIIYVVEDSGMDPDVLSIEFGPTGRVLHVRVRGT